MRFYAREMDRKRGTERLGTGGEMGDREISGQVERDMERDRERGGPVQRGTGRQETMGREARGWKRWGRE